MRPATRRFRSSQSEQPRLFLVRLILLLIPLLIPLSMGVDKPEPLFDAIQDLESAHDAKCHSSANRFEDFVFGTALSPDARRVNVELQKRLVRRLWSGASKAAAEAGKAEIEPEQILPLLAATAAIGREADGGLSVSFSGSPALVISARRADQYGSIAYSLRAILAVRQDSVIGDGALLPLTAQSIAALRETLDAVTLSALMLADRESRLRSDYEIREATLRAVWIELLPQLHGSADEIEVATSAVAAHADSLAMLDRLVDAKTAAYRAYNELQGEDATRLLVFNISRFYARRPLSRIRAERRQFVERFEAQLAAFAATLVQEAGRRAAAAGHPLVRAEDASRAVQHFVPHEIDEFEDVHVFGRLPEAERLTLESFDCDSLRDFGLHWKALQRAAHAAPSDAAALDPFAAEILAEAISQYGVLLLRLAGLEAERDTDDARLAPDDLAAASADIVARAERHQLAPEVSQPASRIASSPAADRHGGRVGVAFSDVTSDSHVRFRHRSSRWLGEFRHKQIKTPPTFSGGGVAAEDVDGDGDVDLLFVGGAGNALLLNDGDGVFEDVTERAGLFWKRSDASDGEPRQPIIADFDNDGRQDILVTYVDDEHHLFRNVGRARFEDVTAGCGLGGRRLVGGPATAFDFDADGLLDVYVGYFGDYLHGGIPTFDRDNRNALPNRLFKNLGGMRFEDVTETSGAADTGWTQAVSHLDFDRDGRQDIVVANDYGRNAFLRNLGDGRFENLAPRLGVTKAFHSMNVGIADLNDDDYPDIYISNLATLIKDDKYIFPDVDTPLHFDLRSMAGMLIRESDMLYMSRLDGGQLAGYVPSDDVERGATSTGWAWDAEFFDFDHDADDDLYLVNGTNDFNTFSMVYRRFYDDGTSAEVVFDHSRESNVLFENDAGRLRNISARSGADFASNSRSTAYLDFDGDGDLDIAVNNFHSAATLLRNDADKAGGGWLKIRLVGDPEVGSNRDAIGARIRLTTDAGARIRREVQGGSGYLSMNPKQQHFGLGTASSAQAYIVWPNGEVQTVAGLSANAAYTIRQGEPEAFVDDPTRRSLAGSE